MRTNLRLIALGAAMGFLSGMFGIGGGFILVPGLIMFLHFQTKKAIGTSLAAIVPIAAAAAASYFFFLRGNVDLDTSLFLAIGGVFGSYLGVKAVDRVHDRRHAKLFSLLLVFIGLLMVWPLERIVPLPDPSPTALVLLGMLVGVLSGFFGIGGAVMLIPLLTLGFHLTLAKAAPVSLVSIALISVASLFQHHKNGNVDTQSLRVLLPPAVAAALVSPYFSIHTPDAILKTAFGALLIGYAGVLYVHARKLPKP